MAKVQILPGHEYDIVSPAEMDKAFLRNEERMDAFIRDAVRGVKPIRAQTNTFTSGAVGASFLLPFNSGPRQGYVWSVLLISLSDSAAAISTAAVMRTSSDVTDIPAVTDASGRTADGSAVQYSIGAAINFSTNQPYSQTYPKGGLMVYPGEKLAISGWTSAATIIGATLQAIEVPAEMVGKLLI